jgi:hypothetical protein
MRRVALDLWVEVAVSGFSRPAKMGFRARAHMVARQSYRSCVATLVGAGKALGLTACDPIAGHFVLRSASQATGHGIRASREAYSGMAST